MFKQLERLALQPQRWGLTGEAEECLGLCVFCLIWCSFLFFWYWLRWRRCGTTVVAGLQLEEESPLRAARLPDHWDDCLFWMTTADNERPDQEPTDCPRTSCIIYSPLVHRGFVFHTNHGPRLCRAPLHRPTLSRPNPLQLSDLCICRGGEFLQLLDFHLCRAA